MNLQEDILSVIVFDDGAEELSITSGCVSLFNSLKI